uniref:Uncharacterized protein MANES_11G120300 n=1 Tax=Rhizophora mucronata TaxID=61149 RepID=A0A2P2M182_RHIMU
MMEITEIGIFMNHTLRVMTTPSSTEIKNIGISLCSSWLRYFHLCDFFSLCPIRIQATRNTKFIRAATL